MFPKQSINHKLTDLRYITYLHHLVILHQISHQVLRIVRDDISRWDIDDEQHYDRHSREDQRHMYLTRGSFSRLAPQVAMNNHTIDRFFYLLNVKHLQPMLSVKKTKLSLNNKLKLLKHLQLDFTMKI